jgi:hypothetical protein
MATVRVTIDLEITTDPHPDTGAPVESLEDTEEVKRTVYLYLQELMDDDSLSYTVTPLS